jgi:hypothetical protein
MTSVTCWDGPWSARRVRRCWSGAAGAEALRRRGVAEPAASLAAQAGIAVLRIAFERWTEGPKSQDIHALLSESLAELKSVAQS